MIFRWLNEDVAPTNPVLPSLPQTKLFLSCNHLFPAILKFVVAAWLDTAEVLAELQLLLMQGDQLIGLVPLWRLMNYTVDLGTVTLCPCLIARIGERGRLNNDFRYHA